MNFKEAYQDDLDNAFFDEEEFASSHMVDGKECKIILIDVTKTESTQRSVKYALNPKETAINKAKYVFYIRDKELKRKVTVNAVITLDGKKYFVHDVKHTEGVYQIAVGIHAV